MRSRLLEARAARPQPARDDKVVTAWNGLAIAALADLGAGLGVARYLEAAERAAAFVLATHLVDGRLRRSSRDGRVGAAVAVADDHGDLAEGLLALHQATGDPRWLAAAGTVLDLALAHFRPTTAGSTTRPTTPRPSSPVRAPTGRGPSRPARRLWPGALLTYGALTASTAHLDAARRRSGRAAASRPATRGSPAGPWPSPRPPPRGRSRSRSSARDRPRTSWSRVVRASRSPGLVPVAGEPDAPGIPLLADRPLVDGRAAAYVCRGFVCDRPTSDPGVLRAQLAGGPPPA